MTALLTFNERGTASQLIPQMCLQPPELQVRCLASPSALCYLPCLTRLLAA